MNKEVLEFIIIPPFCKRHEIDQAKDRLVVYLGYQFPGYSFQIAPFAPVGEEDRFCVLPVMNYIGDDGQSRICIKPKRWLLQEIADACCTFDLKGQRSFAA